MRRSLPLLLVSALLPGVVCLPAHAGDTEAVEQLLENAAYWKERGRQDKVVEVYEKVLRSDPNHATALAELAIHYARQGDKERGESYLRRLQAAHPGDARIASARQAMVSGDISGTLDRARRLASAGDLDGAVAAYREALGSAPPSGALGLEFYQTLGGTSGGWAEARTGMERLERESPGDTAVKLALAQHLTYRDGSRREGITRLSRLAGSAGVGAAAKKSWRQALLWLKAAPGDAPLYRAYLTQAGEDAQVRRRLDQLAAAAEGSRQADIAEGFEALESQDTERADEVFSWAMAQEGRSVDVLVGMALVDMQQEEFENAEKLLLEARRLAPDAPERWEEPLRSAGFWRRVRGADAAQAVGDHETAAKLLGEALELDPAQAHHAHLALGNLYQSLGQRDAAADQFRAVLEADPDNVGALIAMTQHMLEEGRSDAAQVFNDRLRTVAPDKALESVRMRSEGLRFQAALARDVGDDERALTLLAEAIEVDPRNEWALYDLLNLHLQRGELEVARALMDDLLRLQPDLPKIRLLDARLLAEEGRFDEALGAIEVLGRSELSPEMVALREQVLVQVEATIAVRRALATGDRAPARSTLLELQERSADQPYLLAHVGLAWAELGDLARAESVVDRALAATGGRSATIRLQLASVLLKAERYDALQQQLASLAADPALTPRERRGLDSLEIALAVARAEDLREAGRYPLAYDVLAPQLEEHPDDPRLVNALGRVLRAAGDPEGALLVFERVLADRPGNLEAREGAILTNLDLGRRERAEDLVREFVAQRPDDPEVHLLAGRVASMQGRDARAVRSLRQALELDAESRRAQEEARRVAGLTGSGGSRAASYEEVVRASAARLRAGGAQASEEAVAARSLTAKVEAELAQIQDRHLYEVDVALQVRHRLGEGGLSGITDLALPIGVRIPTGYVGHVELEVKPTYVDAGELDVVTAEVADRFGTNGLRAQDPQAPETGSAGVAFRAGWRHKGFGLWVGSTPLGFTLTTVTGGLDVGAQAGRFSFALRGAREPVIDSVLSYAGREDPLSGRVWGGLTRNGGRLDLGLDVRPVLIYAYGGYHALLGELVPLNQQWEAGAGLHWTIVDREVVRFRAGLAGSALGYQLNQRFFSFGHGGYFSPQVFVHGGIPLMLDGEARKLVYAVDADVGVNWFREDEAAWFPTSPTAQGTRDGLVDDEGEALPASYSERTSLSFALTVGARIGYRVSDRIEPTLELRVFTAEQYTELQASLGLRYAFGRRAVTAADMAAVAGRGALARSR